MNRVVKANFLAIAAAAAATTAKAVDITYPADSTVTFSGNTEYVESGDEWGVKHGDALNVSIAGTGNTLQGINGESNPWRKIALTGDGYLTMQRNGQWSIGFEGSTANFFGTLHIKHEGYNQTYFGLGDGDLSFENASIVLEAGSGNAVYFSNYAATRKIGDLSTAGDNPSRINVRKKNYGSLYVGYLNKNSTFGGTFWDEGEQQFNIVKVGTGTWTLNGGLLVTNGTLTVEAGTVVLDCVVSNAVSVGASGTIGGNGTVYGTVSAASGAKLLFDRADSDNVLTFTDAADLSGFTVDATGLNAESEYLVAKGATTCPGVSAAQAALGWMTEAKNGNVYLVNNMRTISSSYALGADEDWSDSVVAIDAGVTINLNGHDLSVGSVTLGEGVSFVNSGAAKSRIYVGLASADKLWALDLAFPANVMPVFVGAAIEIPSTYAPLGGIGFMNTSGQQPLYNLSCVNGLAFLGGANLIEPWKDWNFGAGKSCRVTVEGEGNVFTFNDDNYSTEPGAFTTTPFSGDGELKIVSSSSGKPAAPVVGAKNVDNSGFGGKIVLRPADNYTSNDGFGIKFEDDNNLGIALTNGTVALSWDLDATVHFSFRTQNQATKTVCYNLGNLVTEGAHQECIVLSSRRYDDGYATTMNVGWKNEDGVFAGSITNYNGERSFPFDIAKHGTGTWKLTGTVANGGAFSVGAGCVEFRNGLANVSSLSIASGASALFAGDMGSNPITFASGSTLMLDASNEGGDVPVVNGDLDLTGVSISVAQGSYVPSKKVQRELLRVTGALAGFSRGAIATDIDAKDWEFKLVSNGDGTKSLVHKRRPSMAVILR